MDTITVKHYGPDDQCTMNPAALSQYALQQQSNINMEGLFLHIKTLFNMSDIDRLHNKCKDCIKGQHSLLESKRICLHTSWPVHHAKRHHQPHNNKNSGHNLPSKTTPDTQMTRSYPLDQPVFDSSMQCRTINLKRFAFSIRSTSNLYQCGISDSYLITTKWELIRKMTGASLLWLTENCT